MSEVVLHDFWRSSASYRVRIVLELKGVAYRSVAVDLPSGEQRGEVAVRLAGAGLPEDRVHDLLRRLDRRIDRRFVGAAILEQHRAFRSVLLGQAGAGTGDRGHRVGFRPVRGHPGGMVL